MGGGGHGQPHEVPDWKGYKAEGIPELDQLQRKLGALGLKDPWTRNEVWKFRESAGGSQHWGRYALRTTFRGFGLAVAAMAVTILYDKAVNKDKSDHHGHH